MAQVKLIKLTPSCDDSHEAAYLLDREETRSDYQASYDCAQKS